MYSTRGLQCRRYILYSVACLGSCFKPLQQINHVNMILYLSLVHCNMCLIFTTCSCLPPTQLLEADIVNSTAEGLDVLLHPSGAPAFLPVSHLSDHLSNCKSLLSVYKPSTRLTNVVYYGRNKDKAIVS